MKHFEWPKYIYDNEGNPYRKLEIGELLQIHDVAVQNIYPLVKDWHKKLTGLMGQRYEKGAGFAWLYYRPVTDPLSIAILCSLERKHGVA